MPRAEEVNQRIKDERREKIEKAAVAVFARKGLAGTRITDIAAEAKMSQGLVYHYFGSKEELFEVLVRASLDGMQRLGEATLAQPGTAWDKIEWFARRMLEGLQEDPNFYMLVVQALTSEAVDPELRQAALVQSKLTSQALYQLILEGQASGQVAQADPLELLQLFFLCVQGLAIDYVFFSNLGNPGPRQIKVETLLRILKA